MKRYSILSLLFIFFALGVVAQVDSLILPFGATTLTDEQKASNPDYLAYPLTLASQMPEINCNQTTDCMEPVDLGLSVLWATCNVGAAYPEDYGDYFAWGETATKTDYSWTTYKYCKGTYKTMTKYCTNRGYGYNGFTDNKTILDPEDDAATVNWGGAWRMPTEEEFTELSEKCQWTWTTQNEVNGYKVVGPNGNSIFLPASGWVDGTSLNGVDWNGLYWSSSLNRTSYAYNVDFGWTGTPSMFGSDRFFGMSVRPVCPKRQEHEWVDLGLSVKWATCNVGAEKPEDYGDYFAWGETQPKENYDWTTYKYCKGTDKTMTKYCTNSSYGSYGYNGFTDNKTVLDPEDDAATVNWGGAWRMPTDAEMTELVEQCTWTWTTQNGVNGHKIVGPNGNSIFLSAASFKYGTSHDLVGLLGTYWSSSLYITYSPYAFYLEFGTGSFGLFPGEDRCIGKPVRPICP